MSYPHDVDPQAATIAAQATQIAALQRALRGIWVIESFGETCLVVCDSDGVPFRTEVSQVVRTLLAEWEIQRRAALEMSGGPKRPHPS